MNEQVGKLLAGVTDETLTAIARGVLNDHSATLFGQPKFEEITTPHADLRTIGIYKAIGEAISQGEQSSWSSVVKVIDVSVEPRVAVSWVHPEQEEIIYENKLFVNEEIGFRPARCYGVDRPSDTVKLIWLEDLSDATQPPFSINQLSVISKHLGEFNGSQVANAEDLPFVPPTDSYVTRWNGIDYAPRMEVLGQIGSDPETKLTYRNVPISAGLELYSLLTKVQKKAATLPHSISFGDSQPGNLFLTETETVAIDWASVTNDPTGVDAGVLIGSSMMWGQHAARVISAEEQLYEHYLDGLLGQWSGNPDHIRLAFFSQFGVYLMIAAAMPASRKTGFYKDTKMLTKRFEADWDEIPELLAPVVAQVPRYVEELSRLLD